MQDDSSLMDNQRFKKLCRLTQLGVYVDEAHHLFGADLEKQIRATSGQKTSLRDTINKLADSTSIVACYNYTGTPYVNRQLLPEVVYAYGLRESIQNGFLKDADLKAFENVKSEEFLRTTVLTAINKYNEILDDVVIPQIFHALFEAVSVVKSEDREIVLLKEPKEGGYYEFSGKPELVVTNTDPQFKPTEVARSFHADTYIFDSKPEKECFMQYITSDRVSKIYFTGMFTSNQGDLSIQYYDPESRRIRQYYPDFFAEMRDGIYQLIEVKRDDMVDDAIVKAKAEAATEMATHSGVEYKMYAGGTIMKSHILETAIDAAQRDIFDKWQDIIQ